jgi:hypothetical protein
MWKTQFGSFGKVLFWIFIIGFAIAGFEEPALFVVALFFLLGGPCVAIPAMIAVRGKVVASSQSIKQLKQSIPTAFAGKKAGRTWVAVREGEGALNFALQSCKHPPTVSIAFEDSGDGTAIAHIWMSEWTSGGLNGGKGTPFWVWGGVRALSKVNEIARLAA